MAGVVKVTKANSLAALYPYLVEEWHPNKNGGLTPDDVTAHSHTRAWWKCKRGHEWDTKVQARSRGGGCPVCNHRKAGHDYNLAVTHPDLVKEWHPTNNGRLSPKKVTPGSHKKVWWLCSKKHEWKATVKDRTGNHGCPVCAGHAAYPGNNLALRNPKMAKQWHPTKNKKLTPHDVLPKSNKKVWWICKLGHEWEMKVSSRAFGQGCPYCSGRRTGVDNNLAVLYPALVKEWHFEKNKNLTPRDVTLHSKRKAWWKCAKGHVWLTSIDCRTRGKEPTGCPKCWAKKKKSGLKYKTKKRKPQKALAS